MTKKRKNKSLILQIKKNYPSLLMLTGVIFLSISLSHWYLRAQALRLDRSLIAQYEAQFNQDKRSSNVPVHIIIPWFVDSEIEKQSYIDGHWTNSPDKSSYLMQSARPGEKGNIIVYGHNSKNILGNLTALKGKEIITLTLVDGSKRKYQVNNIVEVDPTQTEFLQASKEEVLTIYTCSGFLDQKRYIVQAKPLEDQILPSTELSYR